jgi:hypothetical protein
MCSETGLAISSNRLESQIKGSTMLQKLLIALALIALVFPALAIAQPQEEEEPIQARPNPTKSLEATSTAEGAPQMQIPRPIVSSIRTSTSSPGKKRTSFWRRWTGYWSGWHFSSSRSLWTFHRLSSSHARLQRHPSFLMHEAVTCCLKLL